MDSISELFRNPSFEKDFAFIKQLEAENKQYQDRIWKKFANMQVSSEDNPRIAKTRFDSHPSGFSSESENSNADEVAEFFRDQPVFNVSSPSVSSCTTKRKERSASAGKMLSSEASRRKLRKKITQHLKSGTIDKFDIKAIGDQLAADRRAKEDKKKRNKQKLGEEDDEGIEEVYLDCSKKFGESTSSGTSKTCSYSSINGNMAEIIDLPAIPKVRKKIFVDVEQPVSKKKVTTSTEKIDEKERVSKSPKPKQNKKTLSLLFSSAELKKTRYYIGKCISITKDIGVILNQDFIPPDGREDHSRRKVRTNEFNSRFSRTYMYPLVRQLSSINITPMMERAHGNLPKLGTTFQLIFQALQAYFNHLPTTLGRNSYHKLKEYLVHVMEVCDKSKKFFEKQPNCNDQDYANVLKSQCTYLINTLDDNFLSASVDSLLKSKNNRASLPISQSNRNFAVNSGLKDNPRNKRFAMYNNNLASLRDRQWRRLIEAIEKRKPKVKSRYRTATFKHRPPVEKQNNQTMIQLGKHRLDTRRSVTSWKNTPVATPLNEDNIQTMIQYEKERYDGRDDSGNDELEEEGEEEEQREEVIRGRIIIENKEDKNVTEDEHQQDDILAKLLRLVQDNQQQADTERDVSLTNTIKVLQQCLDFKNQNSDLFRTMATDNRENLTVQTTTWVTEATIEKKRKKDPVITITGTRNAQLICIQDDNSIVSEVEETAKQVVPQNSPRKTPVPAEIHSSKSELIVEGGVARFPSKFSIRIGRINRPKKMLNPLPRELVVDIIQHKLMFHKRSKTYFLYRQTPSGKPWEHVEKISDEILDYALLGIAKEIEVNELLENLYDAEFQY